MSKLKPVFEITALETQALAVMALLAGKACPAGLTPEQQRRATALAKSLHQGQKAKAWQLSEPFFQQALPPDKIAAALATVQQLGLNGNADFQIMLESLHENYAAHASQQAAPLDPQEAMLILLLAVTHSDKNAIFYQRLDPQSGKLRPTSFPLTEKLLQNFLAPFDATPASVQRYLLVRKGLLLGNPAAYVVRLYQQRKQAHEQALAEFMAAQQPEHPAAPPPATPPKPRVASSPQQIRFVSEALRKLLEDSPSEEREALVYSLQPDQLLRILPSSGQAGKDFGNLLESIYAQRLLKAQAAKLSARMASRMKRMLSQMENWKEDYWSEFQVLMQQMGVWEGQEWLDKWRSHRVGKQAREPGSQPAEPQIEAPSELDQMLARSARQADKRRGQALLAAQEPLVWSVPEQVQVSLEEKKALNALAQSVNLDDVLELALSDDDWESVPDSVLFVLAEGFACLEETYFDLIKTQFLNQIPAADQESARHVILAVERVYNQLLALFRQNRRLGFGEALASLRARQEQEQALSKQTSRDYQNSAAARYHRYQG